MASTTILILSTNLDTFFSFIIGKSLVLGWQTTTVFGYTFFTEIVHYVPIKNNSLYREKHGVEADDAKVKGVRRGPGQR